MLSIDAQGLGTVIAKGHYVQIVGKSIGDNTAYDNYGHYQENIAPLP